MKSPWKERIAELRDRQAEKPCGRRAKYVSGCRCEECRRANRRIRKCASMGADPDRNSRDLWRLPGAAALRRLSAGCGL